MITFAALLTTAPDLAEPIRGRLASAGIGLLGTLRRDGSPRVSPIEVSLQDGSIIVGMMPASRKLRDVQRDPRCALLTAVADRLDLGGEGKLFGRLEPLPAGRAEDALRIAAEAAGFDADAIAGSPVFELLIDGAAWQVLVGETWTTLSWTERDGVRRRRRVGALGLPEDDDPAR